MTPTADHATWLQTFQALLHHYLPPLESTPLINVSGILSTIVGLFLAFRCMKYQRAIVATFAMFVGAWLGYRLSLLIGTPEPISAAIGAVALTVIAYRTYKLWLAAGSVIVLFLIAVVFQLGRGDLQRYLPNTETVRALKDGQVKLVDEAQQFKNLHPNQREALTRISEKVTAELKALGPVGWLVPFGAAIIGGFLAWWALRVFSVIWLSFLGAVIAVLGVSAFLCAHWPTVHSELISRPLLPGQIALGIWVLGLIWQAKEARFPKKKGAEPAKEGAKG